MPNLAFSLSGTLFAVIFLGGLIVMGGKAEQTVALTAALLACISQYAGQDPNRWRMSRWLAYAAMALGLLALLVFAG